MVYVNRNKTHFNICTRRQFYNTNYKKNTFPFTIFIVKLEYNNIKIFITTTTINYAFVLLFANDYLFVHQNI